MITGSSSHKFKQYARQQRKVVSEGIFTGGMDFTDNPLGAGTSRLIVNMVQKDFGQRIRPRGGWRNLIEPVSLGEDLGEMYVHHTGASFVTNTETDEVFLRRYALILSKGEDPDYGYVLNSKVIVEEPLKPSAPEFNNKPGDLKISSLAVPKEPKEPEEEPEVIKIRHDAREYLQKIHGVLINNPTPVGTYSTINGNTYLITPEGLGRLGLYYTDGEYTHDFKLVEPLKVTPIQAVNYGYNMLLKEPYEFENKMTGAFQPQGILPYDVDTGLIKMQAKVGENVNFKLIYHYEKDMEYKVQWEIQDIYKRDGVNIIQKKEDSPKYKNGEEIAIKVVPPFKQFSMVATIFKADDLTNPLRTILLASYHLTDDSNDSNQEQKNYDLMTAHEMVVWKNQTVYYGVKGAEMSILISGVNDPTYVPFPNNTINFNEKVIKVFPFMDSLLVVTEHTMFQVDFGMEDGFTSKPVQTNMQLREDDATAMYGVRNMVCFKSRNYYYMIVPNVKNDKGELQIAPVSNGVTHLLDNFMPSVRKTLSEVYTLKHLLEVPDDEIFLTLDNYQSYNDGNRLRHVYKLKLEARENIHYVDFHMIYDTVFRTWTVEIIETTRQPIHVFQTLSTGYSQLLGMYVQDDETFIQWIGIDELDPEDSFVLGDDRERVIQNYQMFDTGKRDIEGTKKKRFRHVILEINNLSNEDVLFNHMIYIDDDPRSDLFKHSVAHETDPESPIFGRIYVQRDYVDPTTIFGVTNLGTWSLGNSRFPEQTVLKVQLDLTGKGFYPRIKIVTRTSKMYELNQITWAYRDMNAR